MSAFNKSFCFFKNYVSNTAMSFSRFIKGRCDNLSIHITCHIGNFLGSLIDKKDHQVNIGMIFCYRICNLLKKDCFTCLRLCNDQSSLSLSDRGEHIDYPYGKTSFTRCAQGELLIGEQGCEEIKRNPVSYIIGTSSVDLINFYKGEIFLAFFRRTDSTFNSIPGFKSEKFYL